MKLHLPKGLFVAVMTAIGALCQPAMGVTYDSLLSDASDWTVKGAGIQNETWISNANWWKQHWSTTALDSLLGADEDTALTFEATFISGDNYDQSFGIGLIGVENALVIGTPYKENGQNSQNLYYGISTEVNATAYPFNGNWGSPINLNNATAIKTQPGGEQLTYTHGTPVTISGSYQEGTLTLTYSSGETSHSMTYDLGDKAINIDSISLFCDGGNVTISNLSVSGTALTQLETWSGTTGNNTWTSTEDDKKYNNITFDVLTGHISDTVVISGEIVRLNVQVNDDYTFTGNSADDKLTVLKKISIAEGKTLSLAGTGTINCTGISGALEITQGATWTTSSYAVLTGATGTGTLKIDGNMVLGANSSVQLEGKVVIGTGSDLRLGIAGFDGGHASYQNITVDEDITFELAGGTLSSRAFSGALGDVEVTANSLLHLVDATKQVTNNGVDTQSKQFVVISDLTLDADLEIRTKWKSALEIGSVTGTGAINFTAEGGDTGGRDLTINSVNGYTGTITVESPAEGVNSATLNLTVKDGESFNASQIVADDNTSVTIEGAGTYNMGNQTYIAKAPAGEKGSFGADWTGTVTFNKATLTKDTQLSSYGNEGSTIKFIDNISTITGTHTTASKIVLDGQNAARLDLQSDASITFNGTVEGKANMGFEQGATNASVTYTGEIKDWTGILWASASNSTITYSGNARTINHTITAGAGGEGTINFVNSTGMTVSSDIQTQKWTNGTLNLKVLNEKGATGAVTFNGKVFAGTTGMSYTAKTNLEVAAGAAAEFTNQSVTLNNVTVGAGSSLIFSNKDAAPAVGTLELAEGAKLSLEKALTLSDSALTLSGEVTLTGGLLTSLLNGTVEELTLFDGVTTLTLGENVYSSAARNAFETVDMTSYITFVGAQQEYNVFFDGSKVYATATKAVPEPATATLSLLALAGMAMRRRRK